jgi:hypothetical protein
MLWADLRILIVDTGRVWWRLLPMIVGWWWIRAGWEPVWPPPSGPSGSDATGRAPPQCEQRAAHGALSGQGYVPGVIEQSAQPQIGHADPARRTFMPVEVRWNAFFALPAR